MKKVEELQLKLSFFFTICEFRTGKINVKWVLATQLALIKINHLYISLQIDINTRVAMKEFNSNTYKAFYNGSLFQDYRITCGS